MQLRASLVCLAYAAASSFVGLV